MPMRGALQRAERTGSAAERHGFIVVGSNNSRNGPWAAIFAAAKKLK
jgi:hypothetical protein